MPRNVPFIMTDQQHFETLGCHGVAEAQTTTIDHRSAEPCSAWQPEGVRFLAHKI